MVRSITKILVLCMSMLGFSTAHADTKEFLIVGEEFAPFEFLQDGNPVGIDVDIVKAIFDKMGIKYKVQLIAWKRAWSFVESGDADAVLSTSRKDDRKPFLIYPTEDMWTSHFVFFVNKAKKKPSFGGYADAKDLVVGTVRGDSYNPDFFKANLKIDETVNLETNLKKLANGQIDLVPADKTVGLYTAAKILKVDDKVDLYDFELFSKGYPMPFVTKSHYPDIEKVAAQFEAELVNLKKSGEYDKIIQKWTGK